MQMAEGGGAVLAHAPFATSISLEASRETVNLSKYFLAQCAGGGLWAGV